MTVSSSKISVFIVGAQKAGTTALYTFLQEHPSLQFGYKKELHIFNQAGIEHRDVHQEVQKCFPQDDGGESVTLKVDATPMYLYHPLVMERLHRYNPDAKIIVLLRDPSERAYSHWKMTTKMGRESLDFGKVIRFGRSRFDDFHPVFSYVERGLYAEQLDRVTTYFPREQICVLEQSDLLNRHDETLQVVTEFLNIPPFDQLPPSKIVISNQTSSKLSESDRLYLDLLYQVSNEQLAIEWGVDFTKNIHEHSKVVLKPLMDMDESLTAYPGVKQLDVGFDIDDSIHDSTDAYIVPWVFSDAFMKPHTPKILRVLRKKKMPATDLMLYGRLPDFAYKTVYKHCNSISKGSFPSNTPCVLFIESKLSKPFIVADHIVCLRNQVLRYKRRPQDFPSPPPRWTVGPEIAVTNNSAIGYCAQNIQLEELHLLKEAERQGLCILEALSCDEQGRIADWSTAFVFCSRSGDDPLGLVYQSLRAGRIPVFVDVGLALPLESQIAYDQYLIQSGGWESLFDTVARWSLEGDLQQRQRAARTLWVEQLVFPKFWQRILPNVKRVLGSYLS